MKTILVMGLLTLSSAAFSSVVKSYDHSESCNLYRVIRENTKAKQANETTVYSKEVYGLALQDMEVDFDKRLVKAQVMMNVVLGINRKLVSDKSSIVETNTQFNMLINQVNRKLFLLEKVCLSNDNQIIYGQILEAN